MRITSEKSKKNGSRFKVGRPCKWRAGKTKTIRVPIVFLPDIFNLIARMEEKELAKTLITVGHPPSTGKVLCCNLQTRDLQWI